MVCSTITYQEEALSLLLCWSGMVAFLHLSSWVALWDNSSSSALDETLPCPGLQSRMSVAHRLSRSFRTSLRMCRYVRRRQVCEVAVPKGAVVPVLGNHPDLWPPCLRMISPIYSFIYPLAHRRIFPSKVSIHWHDWFFSFIFTLLLWHGWIF